MVQPAIIAVMVRRPLEARLAHPVLGLLRGETVVGRLVDQPGTREGAGFQVALGFLGCLCVSVDGHVVNASPVWSPARPSAVSAAIFLTFNEPTFLLPPLNGGEGGTAMLTR